MMNIDTGQEWLIDMINNLLLEVLSTMAEQDRLRIKTTQAEGIATSKSKGVKFGRPVAVAPPNFEAESAKCLAGEQSATYTYKKLGMCKNHLL